MKKQLVSLGIVFFWVASLIVTQVPIALAQDWQGLSSDIDGDGLLNDLEEAGWYNEAGGPFFTDSLDADSDDDGLTDGEEKLYNMDPLDDESPGIYVQYEDGFLTKQYFSATDPAYLSMERAGDKYLVLEAMVARRGTTFYIGGPSDAALTITGSGLTSLTLTKDPCRGRWRVDVPSSGTVGTYTATLSRSGWSESMPLHVVFELSSDLTQPKIEAFVYDDDPSNLRDETSVWFFAPELKYDVQPCPPDPPDGSPCSDWQYHYTRGLAQVFWTEQFKKDVLLDHTMPAIHGETSKSHATDEVARWADKEFRTNYSAGQSQTFSSALYKWWYVDPDTGQEGWTMTGGACETNANVFTTILRSAGIAARPFLVDWNKTYGHGETYTGAFYQYDHSVLIWLDGHWRAGRSYATGETSDLFYPWDHGIRTHRELADYRSSYPDIKGDLIASANEGWDWASEGGMVNDVLLPGHLELGESGVWDYRWDNISPLEIGRSPYLDILNYEVWHGDGWAPSEWRDPDTDPDYDSRPYGRVATETYDLPPNVPTYVGDMENWPNNPEPTYCSPSTPADVCDDFLAGWGGGLGALGVPIGAAEQPVLGTQPALQAQSDLVQLGAVVGDYGVDLDGNGRFDKLIVEVDVTALQPGNYTIGGMLSLPGDAIPYGGIQANDVYVYLHEGLQTIQLPFDGLAIGRAGENGPYQVAELWVTDLEAFDSGELWDNILDYQQPDYATAPYTADQFETLGALLADVYSHRGLDNDGDGRYEAVAIDVFLDISLPGTYQVEGDLYDGQGDFVGHATWTGSGSVASLQFDLEKTAPPYKLENLRLVDSAGAPLDYRHRNAYTILHLDNLVDQGAITMDLYLPESGGIGPLGLTITPTHVFNDTGVDLDSDGSYDQLLIDVQVEVSEADQYRIEGWLEGPDDSLIVYAVSDPTDLGTGLQTLSLAFDGRAINAKGVDGPYTLIALKVLPGDLYEILDEIDVAYTTSAYDHDEFEEAFASKATVVFEDDMESGSSQWTADSPWALRTVTWRSPSYSWRDSSGNYGNNVNVSLTTKSIAVPELTEVVVMFQGCYDLKPNDYGYVEIQVNGGGAWNTVLTFTGGTELWYSEGAKLDSDDEITSLKARFRLSSDGSGTADGWYIDDVIITGRKSSPLYLPLIMK